MSNQGLIFGVSVLLLVLLEATKETGACCGGPTGCSEDDLYWKRRIAAMRKAKASSSSSVADAKKGEPVWGPPQELICYHCKRLYEGEPHFPNRKRCEPPKEPVPLPKPPMDDKEFVHSVRTGCKPVTEFVECLCSTGTISYACQYQDLMMQGCRMLEKLRPCVEKYADKEALKKMWECDAAAIEKAFAPVPKKAQAEIASVLKEGNCAGFWRSSSLFETGGVEDKMRRPSYFAMLTERLMMLMSGVQPAFKWAWHRQQCERKYNSEAEMKEPKGETGRLSFNITDRR